jgi:thioredoxin 1
MLEATDQTFAAEVEQASVPVLADFHAQWCGPCKELAPLLDQLGQRRGSSLKIVGVALERAPNAAMKYGVRALPTLILFKNGNAMGKRVGNPGSVAELERMVDGALGQTSH